MATSGRRSSSLRMLSGPGQIWISGYEWAKRQVVMARMRFTELPTVRLLRRPGRLRPGTIEVFAQCWLYRIPMPFAMKARDVGCSRECSMQSRPGSPGPSSSKIPAVPAGSSRRSSAISSHRPSGEPRDHLRLQDPSRHAGHLPHRHRPSRYWPGRRRVVLKASCKHSRIKHYLKEARAIWARWCRWFPSATLIIT